MDPFTLFALANGAVAAVKKGCQLYKDIKGAAGEISSVIKDLDEQFHKLHPPEKPATVEQRNNFIRQKNEVITLNKKANAGEHTSVYTELGEHLGTYYDNYYKCIAVFEEEERRSRTEIYTGDSSLGKLALQRVLMRKQLEQMGTELQEIMIYQSPPELGALWTEVNLMMQKMGAEQKILIAKQMKIDHAAEIRRRKKMDRLLGEAIWGVAALVVACSAGLMFVWIINDRIEKYPQYGKGWIPKSEIQRKREAEPPVYIGR